MVARRVLVVENTDILRNSLLSFFQSIGWETFGAPSIEAARSLIPVLMPMITIIDRELGDGDGLDLISDAARVGAGVLIVSARNTAEDRINGLSMGARDYIGKPAHPQEIFLRLKNSS